MNADKEKGLCTSNLHFLENKNIYKWKKISYRDKKRKMNKKIFFMVLLLGVFIIPFVSAMDTEINVKTLPDHKASIFIKEGGKLVTLESFHEVADSEGMISITYTGSQDFLDIIVKVTENGEKILLVKFEGYDAGFPIYIQAKPGDSLRDYSGLEAEEEEEEVEETAAEEEEVEDEVEEEPEVEVEDEVEEGTAGVTGGVISDEGFDFSSISGKMYLIIGGVVIGIVVLLVFVKFGMSKLKDPAFSYKTVKPVPDVGKMEKEIDKAERKIREAKEEISKITNQDKITSAEKKLQEDREALEKLKEGVE